MVNVLLVYPVYPETFWSFKHVMKLISKKAAFPPLGLLTISPMLPSSWEKKLVDLNISELSDEQIIWSDMVFISAMLVQMESAKEVIARCNRLGRKVVAGGPGFTTQYERLGGVDHFVLNEAEITLPMFLKDFEEGTLKKVYSSSERPAITSTPTPDWSLINFKHYATMPVQYSRGCPFDCEFCDIVIMNGRIPRTKSPEQMIGEMQSLRDAGWKGPVFIVDDNFIGNKSSVKTMLASLIDWQKKNRFPFSFTTEASVNLAEDEELMKLMSKANFAKVFLGIETPCIESLQECGKSQNTKKSLREAVQAIHRNGMQVMGGFIVGFDNDSEDIFERQIKFIQQAGVVTAMVGILIALPQTRLWNRLKSEGRLLSDGNGGDHDSLMNYVPKIEPEKIFTGYKKILSNIYSPKEYYRRINTFLKSYKPTMKGRISISDLKAFLRSTWRIGIFSRSRFRYWGLLSKTFFTKPKAFSTAVELAIIGQHFERNTRRIIKAKS